jgi:NitT/TauT family transport system substrate-binding protein
MSGTTTGRGRISRPKPGQRAGIGLALALGLLLAACGSDPEPAAPEDDGAQAASLADAEPVSFALFGSGPASGMERLAFENGFLEDRGLKTGQSAFAVSGPEITAALVNGSAQFGSLTTVSTQPLFDQGECFRYLTAGERNIYEFIASPDLGLDDFESYPENLEGLKGKRIGVSGLGTTGEAIATYVLEEAGVSADEVTFVATGGTASAVAAFREGQVDATWSFAPQLQVLEPDEYTRLTNFLESPGEPPLDNYIQHAFGTTCDFAEENPEVVEAVCAAIWDAYDYANDPANEEAMAEFFAKALSVEQDVAAGFWEQYGSTFPTPEITEDEWNAMEKFGQPDLPDYGEHVEPACATSDPRE